MIEKIVQAKDSQKFIVKVRKHARKDYEVVIFDALKGFVAEQVRGLVIDKKGYKAIHGSREHNYPGDGTHFEAWDMRSLFGGERENPKPSMQLNLYYFFEGGDVTRKLTVMYFNPLKIQSRKEDMEKGFVSFCMVAQARQMDENYRLGQPDRVRFENHPETCERLVARVVEYFSSPVSNP